MDGVPDMQYQIDPSMFKKKQNPEFLEHVFKELAQQQANPNQPQIAEYGSYLYDNGGPTNPPRKYEEGIRYVDPNKTGLLNLKFTPKGGAYEEIDGKYYRYAFTTDKDKINYDPTKGKDIKQDYTLDASESMSIKDKEKYDNRYADQMYAAEEERIKSLAEDGFDASGNYADWRAKGFSNADEYYNYLQEQGLEYDLLENYMTAAEFTGLPAAARVINDPIGTAKGVGNTFLDLGYLTSDPTSIATIAQGNYANPLTGKPLGTDLTKALDATVLAGPLAKGLGLGVKYGTRLGQNVYKVNPFATNLAKNVRRDNLYARQIYGDDAFESFKQQGFWEDPTKSLLKNVTKEPYTQNVSGGRGEIIKGISNRNKSGTGLYYDDPYFSQGRLW